MSRALRHSLSPDTSSAAAVLRRDDDQPHSPHTHPERHSRQQTRRQHRAAAGPRTQQPHAGGSWRDGTERAHLTASDQPHPISRGRPRLHKPSSTQWHRRESHTQAIPPVTLVRSGLRTVRRHDSCGGQRRSGLMFNFILKSVRGGDQLDGPAGVVALNLGLVGGCFSRPWRLPSSLWIF